MKFTTDSKLTNRKRLDLVRRLGGIDNSSHKLLELDIDDVYVALKTDDDDDTGGYWMIAVSSNKKLPEPLTKAVDQWLRQRRK